MVYVIDGVDMAGSLLQMMLIERNKIVERNFKRISKF